MLLFYLHQLSVPFLSFFFFFWNFFFNIIQTWLTSTTFKDYDYPKKCLFSSNHFACLAGSLSCITFHGVLCDFWSASFPFHITLSCAHGPKYSHQGYTEYFINAVLFMWCEHLFLSCPLLSLDLLAPSTEFPLSIFLTHSIMMHRTRHKDRFVDGFPWRPSGGGPTRFITSLSERYIRLSPFVCNKRTNSMYDIVSFHFPSLSILLLHTSLKILPITWP